MQNVTKLVGQTVRIREYRGETKNVVGRVVSVRDTHTQFLSSCTVRRNPTLTRSRYIVKVVDVQDGKYRSYYHSFLNCKPVGVFGRLLLWVRSAFKRSK